MPAENPFGNHKMMDLITRFADDEAGATAIEYGLIAVIVALGIITSLTTLKGNLNTIFSNVNTNLAN